jgi:hypothetical protein
MVGYMPVPSYASTITKWNKNTCKAIHRWVAARSMYIEAIHTPKAMRGLGITDMHNIDTERKVSVFCQWLFSNNIKLRDSTVANLQVEWHKQKLIVDVDNVLNSPSAYTSKKARKHYTLWENMRKYLLKY